MTSLTTVIRLSGKRHPTPGPGEYVIPSLIGREGRHPSLISRRRETFRPLDVPLQALPSTIGDAPKYSLRSRPKDKDPVATPGPNYVPPRLGAGHPASAFHGYVKEPRSNEGPSVPGPLSYIDPRSIGASKNRGFTVKARNFGPDERISSGPGPGHYRPNFAPTLPATRSFTYRPRVVQKERHDTTPGPGQYVIDRSLAHHPASFHIYPKDTRPRDDVPGPGSYPIRSTVGRGVPSFSLRPRIEASARALPNAPYQVVPSTVGQAPKWSFGGRPKEKPPEPSPGPGYVPPPFGKGSRAASLYSRDHEPKKKQDSTGPPGPGEYPIQGSMGQGHKFTLKARQFPPGEAGQPSGPGSGTYLLNFMDAPVPRSIHPRLPDPKDKEKGAPYQNIGSMIGKDGPRWTIGNKEKLELGPGSP